MLDCLEQDASREFFFSIMHFKIAIDHGAVPMFVKLPGPPSDDVCEQAVWTLRYIASDSPLDVVILSLAMELCFLC